MAKVGYRHFTVNISDRQLVVAAAGWSPAHKDAPTENELFDLRTRLEENIGRSLEIVSLHWLRTEFVSLRKAGAFK